MLFPFPRGGRVTAIENPVYRQVATTTTGLLGWTADLQAGNVSRGGTTGVANSWVSLQSDEATPSTSLTRVIDPTFGYVGADPAAVFRSYFYPYQTGFPDVGGGGNRCEVLYFYDKNSADLRFTQGTSLFIGYSIRLRTGVWNNPSSWLHTFRARASSLLPSGTEDTWQFSFDPGSRRLRLQVRGGQIQTGALSTVAYMNSGNQIPLDRWAHGIVEMQCSTGSDGVTRLWSMVDDQDNNWILCGELQRANVQYDGSTVDRAYLAGGGVRANDPALPPISPESTGWDWSCRFATTFIGAAPFVETAVGV